MSVAQQIDIESPDGAMADALERFQSAITDLQAISALGLSDAYVVEALKELERGVRRVPTVRSGLVSEITSRSLPAGRQIRSTSGFLRSALRLSPSEATAWVRDSETLVPRRSLSTGEELPAVLPAVAAGVADGGVSSEHSRLIQRTMRAVPPDVGPNVRAEGEATLVEAARQFDPVALERLCHTFLACVDPDGSLGTREHRDAQRSFTIGRQDRYGMYRVRGKLDPETGALLKAALEPLAKPQHTELERDSRTAEQRNHDALRDLAGIALRSDLLPHQGGLPVTLMITATLEQIEQRSGVVSTLNGGLMPLEDVLRLAAQTRHVPIVFDTTGEPLFCGREVRLGIRSQRHTIYVMDRGCVIPGCDQPAQRTQVHHFKDYALGGLTDVDQMGLLCPYHHHRIDGWTLERIHGRVWCTPPKWLDPDQIPRLNSVFHLPELFDG